MPLFAARQREQKYLKGTACRAPTYLNIRLRRVTGCYGVLWVLRVLRAGWCYGLRVMG